MCWYPVVFETILLVAGKVLGQIEQPLPQFFQPAEVLCVFLWKLFALVFFDHFNYHNILLRLGGCLSDAIGISGKTFFRTGLFSSIDLSMK